MIVGNTLSCCSILLNDRNPNVTDRSPFELGPHSAKGQVSELKQSGNNKNLGVLGQHCGSADKDVLC